MCRRPCSMTKKPYSSRSDAVGTVNKSISAISSLWLRKNATQRFIWSGSAGSRGMYRDTVFSEMMKPSFVSSVVDTRCAPAVLCHLPDEPANLRSEARPSRVARARDARSAVSSTIGLRDFTIADPDGFAVRFATRLDDWLTAVQDRAERATPERLRLDFDPRGKASVSRSFGSADDLGMPSVLGVLELRALSPSSSVSLTSPVQLRVRSAESRRSKRPRERGFDGVETRSLTASIAPTQPFGKRP